MDKAVDRLSVSRTARLVEAGRGLPPALRVGDSFHVYAVLHVPYSGKLTA